MSFAFYFKGPPAWRATVGKVGHPLPRVKFRVPLAPPRHPLPTPAPATYGPDFLQHPGPRHPFSYRPHLASGQPNPSAPPSFHKCLFLPF